MKKIILPLALLVGTVGAAHAQKGAFKYGIKGGFSLSTYTGGGDISNDVGFKPGFAAGVLFNYGLSDMASIQLEGLYSQKGAFKDTYGQGTTSQQGQQYRSTLSYIDVPLLFKYTFGGAENGKGFFIELGPQASFAAGSREFLRPQGAKVGSDNETEIFQGVGRLVPVGVGYVGGLGYQITSGLGLDARFTGDFTNVFKDGFGAGGASTTASNNFRNGVFQLQAHYLFGGNK